jgi:hypothetical protein
MGFMPSLCFMRGPMGVISRSGSLSYEGSKRLTLAGIGPRIKHNDGMKPIFALPGEMMPGELGPTSRAPLALAAARISMVSRTGISSAVATTSLQPASMASIAAARTSGGGTNTIAVSALVALHAA